MAFNISKYHEIYHYLENTKSITKIIAVTKNRPVVDIKEALNAGIEHFGETKVQEALMKFIRLKSVYLNLRLHMIGALQTNKVKKSLKIFDLFHSLDRENLANEFSKYPELTTDKYFFYTSKHRSRKTKIWHTGKLGFRIY